MQTTEIGQIEENYQRWSKQKLEIKIKDLEKELSNKDNEYEMVRIENDALKQQIIELIKKIEDQENSFLGLIQKKVCNFSEEIDFNASSSLISKWMESIIRET